MEKDFDKSGKTISKMIKLIAQIEVNNNWSKNAEDYKIRENCYNELKEEIKELSDLLVKLCYVETHN